MTPASIFSDEISPDFHEAVATAADCGLQYVDLRNAWGKQWQQFERQDWQRMLQSLQERGMRLGCIQSQFGKCDIGEEYETQHFPKVDYLIEEAQFFNVKVIRMFPFWNADHSHVEVRPNLAGMLPQIAEQLGRALRKVDAAGLTFAIEPEHSTYSGSLSEVRMVIDAVGSPALKVAWDVANDLGAEPLFPNRYAVIRGLVANVHVKERAFPTPGTPGAHMRVLLGTGAVPWPDVITALQADGYAGLYSIETHFGSRGTYGWPKLKAASTWYMYALRELLENAHITSGVG
ncbi:MAG TPA: sugar phosphate isomerase/epimerase family protein [Chloroflexota bacterium]